MSVEFEAVSGFGVEITNSILASFLENTGTPAGIWEDDPDEVSRAFGLLYRQAGNLWTGDNITEYFLVEGETLQDVLKNVEGFTKKMATYGTVISLKDLKHISEVLIS